MKTLYLDLFSGISGDMFIGALIDLGVDAAQLEKEILKLGVAGYHLHVARKQKSSIEGVKFDVHLDEDHPHPHSHPHDPGHGHEHSHSPAHSHSHSHDHPHSHGHGHEPAHAHGHDGDHVHGRTHAEIRGLISGSALSDWVKQRSLGVFQRIAVAEGRIHGVTADKVHFHEVGALDSIVDVVGACIGLELLGKPRVLASRVCEGFGWIQCDHGRFPIPAPATLAILGARGIPVTQCEEPFELVTPTGAAILAEFAESFGPMTDLVATRIGYGLGTRNNKTRPNVLRAVLAESGVPAASHDWETDTVQILETNIDDASPEVLGHVLERALAAGALDVFHTPVLMKKNRPGTLLTVLSPPELADALTELILRETTAFGVRRIPAERRKLRREFTSVTTPLGDITVKLGRLDGRVVQAAPEFESCKAAAARGSVPIRQAYEAALKAWSELTGRSGDTTNIS